MEYLFLRGLVAKVFSFDFFTNLFGGCMSFKLQREDLILTKNFIAGVWQDAVSGATIPVNNPASGERVTLVADSDEKDAKAAVEADS